MSSPSFVDCPRSRYMHGPLSGSKWNVPNFVVFAIYFSSGKVAKFQKVPFCLKMLCMYFLLWPSRWKSCAELGRNLNIEQFLIWQRLQAWRYFFYKSRIARLFRWLILSTNQHLFALRGRVPLSTRDVSPATIPLVQTVSFLGRIPGLSNVHSPKVSCLRICEVVTVQSSRRWNHEVILTCKQIQASICDE